LTFEEVMSRVAETTRGTYIKLRALADSIGSFAKIGFTSPVLVVAGDELKDLLKQGRIHCEIVDLTPDVIKVEMNCSENPIIGRLRPSVHHPQERDAKPVTVPAGHKLTIPLEFVRAVWKDQKSLSHLEHLSITLDANIVWNDEYWSLVTSASRVD